ncbi:MAG TPA: ComEC/Rec2 family competence protein [Thermoleophilaceae bacterium]|nr:ComEC/Rec2 family competence protein [Thermoleophilaceae bacterium]
MSGAAVAALRDGALHERALRLAQERPRHLSLAALAVGLALAEISLEVTLLTAAFLAIALNLARSPRTALAASAAVLLGALSGHARLAAIDAAGAGLEPGDHVEGPAHMLGPPRPGPFGSSAEVRMVSGDAVRAKFLARLPRRARLPPDAGAGTELRISGSLRKPKPPEPDGFDLGAYLRRRGVAGELQAETSVATGRRRGGPAGLVDAARRRGERSIAAGLERGPAALARGMVLGQDELIDPATKDDFRTSGLAHLLAVSGQNVMLLAALALPLLAAAGMAPAGRIAVTVALVAVYVPLAGAGPSLQRAGVMGAASLVALAAARPATRWYALLLAACVTLAVNPRATGDPGWQLSFAAVAGILVLAPPVGDALGGLPRALADGVAITVAATVATAPLLAHHFGTLSLAGLPANVLALPVVAPVMWLGLLRVAVGQVPGLDAVNYLLGLLLEPMLRALGALATAFAQMPGAEATLPLGSRAAVTVAYAALAGVALLAHRALARTDTHRESIAGAWRRLSVRRRAAVAAGAAAVAALALARLTAAPAPPDQLTVTFLDVGQGDATLIQHPDGTAVLFDGGPPEGRVVRLLRTAGVRRLSAMVMTHASRDHHGGLPEVVQRFPIDLLLYNADGTADHDFRAVVAGARRHRARLVKAIAPMELRAGALTIRVLSPPPRPAGPPPEDPNARAVVATVSAGEFDLLLSADAESEALAPLTLPDVEAMKVPHHGSGDPGLPAVLDRLRPEVAAIEVGEDNTYGHPHPATLNSLRQAHVSTYRTDRNGSVKLTVAGGEMYVKVERGGR